MSGAAIQLCEYSLHPQPFRQHYRNGLDTYVIRLQAEGEAEALIEGSYVAVLPGDLMLFQPGELYDLRIGEKESPLGVSGDYYVMCTGSLVDEWWARQPRPKKTRIAADGKILGVWQQLILEKRRLDGGSAAILEALLLALCLLLDRAIAEAPATASPSALLALKMKSYIEEHAAQPLRLEEVASHVGLSVTRAVHLFKERHRISILQYASQIRLAMALRLMESSQLTLEVIAEECGFGSYTYFHRVFREHYGVAPGQYRSRS
jgi:AraC family transcriptional regulator of arabinose operon